MNIILLYFLIYIFYNFLCMHVDIAPYTTWASSHQPQTLSNYPSNEYVEQKNMKGVLPSSARLYNKLRLEKKPRELLLPFECA